MSVFRRCSSLGSQAGEMKKATPAFSDITYLIDSTINFGAGKANRTPDPNLGKFTDCRPKASDGVLLFQ